jgi:hypothetical protein
MKCLHPVLLDSREQPGVDVYVCARCDTTLRLMEYISEPAAEPSVWIIEGLGTNDRDWYPQGRYYDSERDAAEGLRVFYDPEKLHRYRIVKYARATDSGRGDA